MKHKIEKLYTFEGLGFPVILTNAPMIEVRGEYILDIDFNKLQKAVLLHLCHKKTPLTGNEVRFIREYFSLATTAFGRLFGYSHSAVLKWENQEDAIARIAPTAEVYLRLFVLNFLNQKATDFKSLYHEICVPELAEYLKRSKTYTYIP